MPEQVFTVLIVDDEELGRVAVRRLVEKDDRFKIVGECSGGAEAIQSIRLERPDLVFLDIQMPEVGGFDVITELGEAMPMTVMVTAFDQHAIRAFDHHALDYVLKPLAAERFSETLSRAYSSLNSPSLPDVSALSELVAALGGGSSGNQRFTVRTHRSLVFFRPEELESVEAAGNYVKLIVGGEEHLVRDTLTAWTDRLEPGHFSRIHRSILVNRNHVRELRQVQGGSDAFVVLKSGRELPVTRSWRAELERRLLEG